MKKKKLESLGWILFACGSLIYLVDSILHQNVVSALGGLAFFCGCIFFIVAENVST